MMPFLFHFTIDPPSPQSNYCAYKNGPSVLYKKTFGLFKQDRYEPRENGPTKKQTALHKKKPQRRPVISETPGIYHSAGLAFLFLHIQESERQIPSIIAFDPFSPSARIWDVR